MSWEQEPQTKRKHPRGHQSVTSRMREAHARYCAGERTVEIARSMGERTSMVTQWISWVHEANKAERLDAYEAWVRS